MFYRSVEDGSTAVTCTHESETMADSNAAVRLTPEDLDQIEDVLELCEEPGFTAPAGMSEAAMTRLDAYRDILEMTREAMTFEDVPSGLLDGVLAEATMIGPIPSEVAPKEEGFWSRLRRSFVLPSFAVVATAVAVLVLVQPDDANNLEAAAPARQAATLQAYKADKQAVPAAAAEVEKLADEDAKPQQEEAAAEELAEGVEDKKDEAGDYEQAPGSSMANTMQGPPPAKAKKSAARDGAHEPDIQQQAEPAKPAPAVVLEKDELIPLVEQADSLRKKGKCKEAISLYEQAKSDGGFYGARAFAGLGLCAYVNGNETAAEGYFATARAKSASMQGWIDTELDALERDALNSKKPKRKSKKSASGTANASPFDADAL